MMFQVTVVLVSAMFLLAAAQEDPIQFESGHLAIAAPCADCGAAEPPIDCEIFSVFASSASYDSFRLARSIKHCQDLVLPTELRAVLSHFKTTLPVSVRNAIFLNEVCIVNKKFDEYLYSPDDGYLYPDSIPKARRVFSWISTAWNHHGKGDWKLIKHADNVFFIVSVDNGDYLTADDVVVDKRRQVSTVTATKSYLAEHEDRLLWSLETAGDFMYIKNMHVNEYLYAVDGLNYDDTKRTISTWSSEGNGCSGDNACFWQIKPC